MTPTTTFTLSAAGGDVDATPAPDAPPADRASDPAAPAGMPQGARLSFLLLAVFAATYFGTAILTSATFKDLAALRVAGAPLAFLLGLLVIVVGLAVTRINLVRGEH